MRYRKLDDDGDMVFGGGQSSFYRDQPEAVRQAVVTRLALWTGQWFLDLSAGTPWQTQVLGKYTTSVRDAVLRRRIKQTTGLTSLDSYSSTFDPETRSLVVEAVVSTQYGQTKIVESL